MRDLVLHLKREYWEAIRDGRKTHEFRMQTPYWNRRLGHADIERIVLCLGYPKRGDESRRLYRKWNGYTPAIITHKVFGVNSGPVEVWAIDVTEEWKND